MTDPMRDEAFDRELGAFLAWQAADTAGAPSANEVAARIGSHGRSSPFALSRATALGWLLIAGLLLAAAGAVVGGFLQRDDHLRSDVPPPPAAYEAIFLRRGTEVDGTTVVVAVDATGHERRIATLPVRTNPNGAVVPLMGAVSPQGRLAMPVMDGGQWMHWKIFDLRDPAAKPLVIPGIEQDSEQIQATPYFRHDMRPSVFWGPDEHVAIPWYDRLPDTLVWHVGFVDGRTGAATSVAVPDDLRVRAEWASDGSGVFVGPIATYDGPGSLLRPDGAIDQQPTVTAEPACRTHDRSGARPTVDPGRADAVVGFACLAPDDSMILVSIDTATDGGISPRTGARLVIPGKDDPLAVDGEFAGWLGVDR